MGEENIDGNSQEEMSPQMQDLSLDRFSALYVQAMQQKDNRDKITGINLDQECTF